MKTIFAVDNKWGLGKQNGLLFSLKEDMRHFVAHTKDKIVVMGSNTLLSLPNGMPLKNRTNIVLNPNGDDEDAKEKGYILVKSLDELFATLKKCDLEQVYVIGGAMMYRTLLPYCDTALITHVDAVADEADTKLPVLSPDEWKQTECSEEYENNGIKFRFTTYKRIEKDV